MTAPNRLPSWLKKRIPLGGKVNEVDALLNGLRLNTVCQGAHCPNRCECFDRGTATFMIMGDTCTRNCRFCAVFSGQPKPLEEDEPARLAEAVKKLGLKYVVITSVTRDDLADGGAEHFARTIHAVRNSSGAAVEVLTPDFEGRAHDIDTVIAAEPEVFNHNVETVPRLYTTVRPQASYIRSLDLLRRVAKAGKSIAKSGIMVGLGETESEIYSLMDDLAACGCQMLTIGQYLRPSDGHLPVERFVTPEEFEKYKEEGVKRGLKWVASAPFVRSSYRAEAAYAAVTATEK